MLSIQPVITKVLRNRWLAVGVHAGLWLLLYLAVTHLGGRSFPAAEADASANPPQCPVPVARLGQLFSPAAWPKSVLDTNTQNPFFTRHFIPPVSRPPTTRKIEVTYQGFYQAGDGIKQTICKLGDAFIAVPVGGKIATNLFVADATMQTLTLTNRTAQTTVLLLNAKKELEVPIQ